MVVSVNEITQIKAGKVKSFVCETPRQARSGQSQVSYVKKFCRDRMPDGVVDYETTVDGNVLTVMAIRGEK